MRHLILSDMHANADALDAVLRAAPPATFDSIVVLGDLVGYGASPNEVVDRVRATGPSLSIVRGNHDKVVAGLDDGRGFNPVALTSVLWTQETLVDSNRRFLQELPLGPKALDGFLLCHGSPLDEDQYVLSQDIARQSFEQLEFSLCFFGHTHIPCVFRVDEDSAERLPVAGTKGSLEVRPGVRYLINPGSIGQPRDRDPRAAFMTYDSESRTVEWRRIEYDVSRAQQRILDAGLPELLAERLSYGI